jgi:hypothetical protein
MQAALQTHPKGRLHFGGVIGIPGQLLMSVANPGKDEPCPDCVRQGREVCIAAVVSSVEMKWFAFEVLHEGGDPKMEPGARATVARPGCAVEAFQAHEFPVLRVRPNSL